MNESTDNLTILLNLNEQKALNNIPVIVYLGILSIVGFIGNLHVLLVYTLVLKPTSNYRIFVLFLAGLDILACSLVMPFDIFVFRYPYMFYYKGPCKVFNFFKALAILGSAYMLLVIAVERFQKICKPFGWQMTTKSATVACIIATIAASLLSWPNSVFKGYASVILEEGVRGTECDLDDYYKGTATKRYPVIYYGFLFVVYLAGTISLIVLYLLIGKRLYKHAKMKRAKLSKPKETSSAQQTQSSGNEQTKETTETSELSADGRKSATLNSLEMKRTNMKSETAKVQKVKPVKVKVKAWDRMTKILFVITVMFALTFLPHLILVPITILNKSFKSSLDNIEWPIYSIFRKFFYLNHMANPIIYSFYDTTFRQVCLAFYRKICFCRK